MLGGDELEKLSTEYIDRTIHNDVYCSQCGYNLRTRGYIDRCPECGSNYNARSLEMKGVFTAQLLTFPIGDLFATIVSGACTVYLAMIGLNPPNLENLAFAVLFAIPAVIFGHFTWRGARRYFHYTAIAKQIDRQERY